MTTVAACPPVADSDSPFRVPALRFHTPFGERFIVRHCAFCGGEHIHGPKEGHRVAHCPPHLAPPEGYVVIEDPLRRAWPLEDGGSLSVELRGVAYDEPGVLCFERVGVESAILIFPADYGVDVAEALWMVDDGVEDLVEIPTASGASLRLERDGSRIVLTMPHPEDNDAVKLVKVMIPARICGAVSDAIRALFAKAEISVL